MDSKPGLLRVKDVMTRLNVSRRTIYYWIREGILKPIRLGGLYRFHPEDIDALIESQRHPEKRKIRVLSIDDDFLIRTSLQTLLKQYDFEAVCVSSLEEALAELQREYFDVVITDLRMPGTNGIESLKKIRDLRSQMSKPPMPEMILTGYDEDWAKDEAHKMGVRSFMLKPFDLQNFLSEIKRLAHEARN